MIFRVAGTFTIKLAKALDVVERHRERAELLVFRIDSFHAGEVQHRIEQHRGVPDGENEAISIGPHGVVGVEAQKSLPQAVDHRGHRHRRAGMAGVSLLHGIHRQRANGVNAQLFNLIIRHRSSFSPSRSEHFLLTIDTSE